jgi:hypothetical protein
MIQCFKTGLIQKENLCYVGGLLCVACDGKFQAFVLMEKERGLVVCSCCFVWREGGEKCSGGFSDFLA